MATRSDYNEKRRLTMETKKQCKFEDLRKKRRGSGSSVGIGTGYRLDGPGIESRWGARFSAPVQTGPGAHPASCTVGTGSFPGVASCTQIL
jgi:hypothetical protein